MHVATNMPCGPCGAYIAQLASVHVLREAASVSSAEVKNKLVLSARIYVPSYHFGGVSYSAVHSYKSDRNKRVLDTCRMYLVYAKRL